VTDPRPTLQDRYLQQDGTVYLSGIHALVRLLCDRIRHDRRGGLRSAAFVSGYEGSPLAGFDLELARCAALLERHDIVHRPGLNEELAATSVMGTQLAESAGPMRTDGVLGVWYGKAPGLDRATDALRHANYAGTHPRGGALALVGDDPTAKSSSVPSASELELADLCIPVFYPADPQDVLDLAPHAIELSRACGVWSAMKLVTNVADAAGTARVRSDWTAPDPALLYDAAPGARPYAHRPSGLLLGAKLAELERSLHTVRLPLVERYLQVSGVNRLCGRGGAGTARIGLVSAGKPYLDLCQALDRVGLDAAARERYGIRILRLGAIHPVEPGIVREFADGLSEIIVVEEKRPFVETALKQILYAAPAAPAIHGKTGPDGRPLFSALGELDPDTIAAGLAKRLAEYADLEPVHAYLRSRTTRATAPRTSLPLLTRTPYFCSGCPHNSSTKVPEGAVVGAGIGCHTMTVLMEPEQVGTIIGLTQMGGEGAQWIGIEPFSEREHFVQNIGDGTFTHSGSLAVRAAIAAGVDITYKLLYNSVVAMTGGQQAVGAMPVERVAALLQLEGCARVVITSEDPSRIDRARLPKGVQARHRDELMSVQRELASTKGVTVLIHDQECAIEKRRRRRRRGESAAAQTRVLINERVCEGCGDCGAKSNCLSVRPVDTEFGRKTRIDQSSCNVDYSCLDGDCPSFLTVVPVAAAERPEPPDLEASALDEPVRALPSAYAARITGTGGTGVVTVAQVLAVAASTEGLHVRVLDQTGLAQKGGAVVSDIKITSVPVEHAARLATGQCDLYLACDQLVGAEQQWLTAADPERTCAVVSTAEVPTGPMIVDPGIPFPETARIRGPIEAATARTHYVDAHGIADALFGDTLYANLVQLGAAYQHGAIPMPAAAIEEAIALNGVAVARNIQAFRRGRQSVADPKAVQALRDGRAGREDRPGVGSEPDGELARLLRIRVPDLVRYQNSRYARDYTDFIERVRRWEAGPTEVTEVVARNLHKLMAYKDEYEVARLSLDAGLTASLEAAFGPGARVSHRLHPPLLRALGIKRKIALGRRSARPVFRLLYALRGLRGTLVDPFGHTAVRRAERAVIQEYRDGILTAIRSSAPADAKSVVVSELAGLPEEIRGYEHIKLAAIAAYRDRRTELLAKL